MLLSSGESGKHRKYNSTFSAGSSLPDDKYRRDIASLATLSMPNHKFHTRYTIHDHPLVPSILSLVSGFPP